MDHERNYQMRRKNWQSMTSSGSNARIDPVLEAAIKREALKATQGSTLDIDTLADAVYGGLAARQRLRALESSRGDAQVSVSKLDMTVDEADQTLEEEPVGSVNPRSNSGENADNSENVSVTKSKQ